jgi:hypothetical protein
MSRLIVKHLPFYVTGTDCHQISTGSFGGIPFKFQIESATVSVVGTLTDGPCMGTSIPGVIIVLYMPVIVKA